MENYDVAVVRCKTYNVETVKPALEEALNAVNGLDFVKPGMKIIIKPNLVSFKKPDAAATTHPALLEALVELSPGTESFLKQMELFRSNFQNATHFIPVF